MATIGVELTPSQVRAVRRGWRGQLTSAEFAWTPDVADDAAAALRSRLGTASSVRLSISPSLLRVKEVQLPNVAATEQWRAIALQPARYFAETTDSAALAVAWHRDSRIAFAADATRIAAWMRAFAALGPVTAILPSPVALQYAAPEDGTYELSAEGESVATATIEHGHLTHARVARRNHVAATGRALPPSGALGGEWTAAVGAAAATAMEDWESLTTGDSQRSLRTRRVRTLVAAAAALVIALIGALIALDYARGAYELRLDRAIASAETDAQPGLALRRRLAGLEREAQLLRSGASSNDVVQTLAALSELLPRSIVVTRLRMTGDEWQASGRARGGEAAAIVPALGRDARFTDVRMTSPSTRFREDAQEFESFSVAFRVRPTD